LLASIALGATAARADVPDAVLHHAWSEVTTPHVRVLTDAGPVRARHVAERLERLHEQVSRTIPALARETTRPRTVFLFRDDATYRAYLPTFGGRAEEASGIFQPGPGRDWVMLEDGSDAMLDPVALHEYTHALVRVLTPTPPLWLNEGLAQYFSTLRVDAVDAKVGEPAPELVGWMKSHDLLPVQDLVAMTYQSPAYHYGEQRNTFYAESWLLVHLLLNENPGDLPRWQGYLDALARGDDPRAAFRDAFGEERQLQWRLELYAHRPTLTGMAWTFAQPFASLTLQSRDDVPVAEVVAALGDMRLWQPGSGPQSADDHRLVLRQLAPDDPATRALEAAVAARASAMGANRLASDGPAVAPVPGGEGTMVTIVERDPPSADELAGLTPLLHTNPVAARAYLRSLLARPMRPGARACAERLLDLLGP
jgi:hypothetical protein